MYSVVYISDITFWFLINISHFTILYFLFYLFIFLTNILKLQNINVYTTVSNKSFWFHFWFTLMLEFSLLININNQGFGICTY